MASFFTRTQNKCAAKRRIVLLSAAGQDFFHKKVRAALLFSRSAGREIAALFVKAAGAALGKDIHLKAAAGEDVALCGAELGAPEERTAAAAVRRKSDSLASLLGEGAEFTPGADLTPDENYGRFCRNCVHFLAHPFKTLCSKYNRPADPMGDCPEFEKRKEQA